MHNYRCPLANALFFFLLTSTSNPTFAPKFVHVSCLETSAIDLKLEMHIQNGLNSQLITFFQEYDLR